MSAHPIASPSSPAPGATRRSAAKAAPSVLLVDDDAFTLAIVEHLLRDLGVTRISAASGGQAALAALRGQAVPPELILCDLNMPGGDGFEFMGGLAATGYAGHVALISGMDTRTMNSAALMAQFHRLRVVGTLSKPIHAHSLAAVLDLVR